MANNIWAKYTYINKVNTVQPEDNPEFDPIFFGVRSCIQKLQDYSTHTWSDAGDDDLDTISASLKEALTAILETYMKNMENAGKQSKAANAREDCGK